MGTLYLVATPIGNLEDITLRALKVLKNVALIAAEDTRTTRALLTHYDIHTPLTSNHNLNERIKIQELLQQLQEKDIAIVSDAGTPLINDPGYPLVEAAITTGIKVVPIPGPSSPITALCVSGLPADQFVFLGYVPRKSKERKAFLMQASAYPCSLICLETPHRIRESLDDILFCLGDRPIAICRELTKVYEEVLRITVVQAIEHFKSVEPIGEFTLVIGGAFPQETLWPEPQVIKAIQAGLAKGLRITELSKEVSRQSGWNRKEIYDLSEKLKL
jgi:16S rRNA (cytidine1402-2'-O)-methyltransferase